MSDPNHLSTPNTDIIGKRREALHTKTAPSTSVLFPNARCGSDAVSIRRGGTNDGAPAAPPWSDHSGRWRRAHRDEAVAQPTRSMTARRIRFLPSSWTCAKAALLSRMQLPDGPVTSTVMDLSLSRFVTLSLVPTGNWLLDAAGSPASPESVTVEPAQTTSPASSAGGFVAAGGLVAAGGFVAGGFVAAGGFACVGATSAVQPAAARRCWMRSTTAWRFSILAADCESGRARWSAMKLRLFCSAWSNPAHDSPDPPALIGCARTSPVHPATCRRC